MKERSGMRGKHWGLERDRRLYTETDIAIETMAAGGYERSAWPVLSKPICPLGTRSTPGPVLTCKEGK